MMEKFWKSSPSNIANGQMDNWKSFEELKEHQSKKFKVMKRYCLALDLKDDPELIKAYDDYHKEV